MNVFAIGYIHGRSFSPQKSRKYRTNKHLDTVILKGPSNADGNSHYCKNKNSLVGGCGVGRTIVILTTYSFSQVVLLLVSPLDIATSDGWFAARNEYVCPWAASNLCRNVSLGLVLHANTSLTTLSPGRSYLTAVWFLVANSSSRQVVPEVLLTSANQPIHKPICLQTYFSNTYI